MNSFIKGLELNKGFYLDIVKPLLDKKYPDLIYSAALMGYGSDVLGYDTEVSMDHNWGPRLQLFLDNYDIYNELNEYLCYELPFQYKNFSTNYSEINYHGILFMEHTEKHPVNHLIKISTFEDFLKWYSINKITKFTYHDWLSFSDQKLLEVTSGLVFYDGLNKINNTREELKFYPPDICKLRMAVLWGYIWNKKRFIKRSMEINDFIGLKINVDLIVKHIIKILFYTEEKYIPYSKWLGHAFKELIIYNEVNEILINLLKENIIGRIDEYLTILIEKVIGINNKNNKLPYLDITKFNLDRPHKEMSLEHFTEGIMNSIEDKEVKNMDFKKYGYDILIDM